LDAVLAVLLAAAGLSLPSEEVRLVQARLQLVVDLGVLREGYRPKAG
jgi:hypothetical protein